MPNKAFADVMTEWQKLLTTVAANQADLPYVEEYRQQLEIEVTGAKAANVRQLAALSEAQQASRDLDGFRIRGRDLANRIGAGIKSKYGIRSEKLKEFDIEGLPRQEERLRRETAAAGGTAHGGTAPGSPARDSGPSGGFRERDSPESHRTVASRL